MVDHILLIIYNTKPYPLSPGDDFTLEKIIDLGLDQYSTSIGEISSAASKELSIEQAITGIKSTWETMELDISPYKDRGIELGCCGCDIGGILGYFGCDSGVIIT